MRRWTFTKGHGTENDFVLLLDREGSLAVSPAQVRWICDRRAGVGADGLLRVVLARHMPGWEDTEAQWFMDYRNADGSVAEMCGNGVRVFARYLLDEGLANGPTVPIGTRDGVKSATALPDGRIRVAMGPVTVHDTEVDISTADGRRLRGRAAEVGNPHAVSFVEDLADLPLHVAPVWSPVGAFPEGVNQEFVRRLGDRHVAMRVFERGVGETRSCGTGTVAVAAVAHATEDHPARLPTTYRVDVLGGSVEIELTQDQAYLTGPAVLVAHGELMMPKEG
ncbi:MAG: Diaminopimelate epimerase [Friedmanniella sp.]|nr:Diaminopimelate epimerase [Friedmanniella sp.]